jgi:hypothetical protein
MPTGQSGSWTREPAARLGVQCLEALYNRVDTDLINRYLAIKQREMI